jgi:methylglutaconyl-CoA hydratase
MEFRFLQRSRAEDIEYLTLNRPEVRNAFNEDMIAELRTWTAEIARDANVRGVVLAGAGPVFCAGADAVWMRKQVAYTEEDNLRDAAAASQMFTALDALPMPVVARVHGAALGGGAGLAAVADIVVAGEQAVFGFTEVKLGILPAVISPYVLEKIGSSAAREYFLTGARFPAARAREIGLVHTVVPEMDLDAAVDRYVREILAGGREAIAAAKSLVREIAHKQPADVSAITASAIARRRVSPEGQEGLTAFLEKRNPSWSR